MTIPILTYLERGRPLTPTGASEHDPLVRVDLARLVAGRLLIQANSGGGKSWAIRQLAEETYSRIPQIILDPEGEFYTLRGLGDYVLAAKSGGDVEASVKTARTLCRRLIELQASAVIDLYELKLAERREFVRVFLTELVNLPRTLWHPTLVVLDEAHMYAPEGSHGQAESTEAVIALATLGRKRGFALVAATQRLSKLHKDLAAELNTKLIGRTGLDVDVKRAGDELGFGKDDRAQLARLDPGTFFAYGPAIPGGVVVLARTGGVHTTHPEPGQLAAAAPPASSKVRALIASALADLPKEAAEEAKTIDDLKRQNAELSRKLRQAERTGTVVEKPVRDEAAIAAAVDRARSTWTRDLRQVVGKDAKTVSRAMDRVFDTLSRLTDDATALAGAYKGLARDLDLEPPAVPAMAVEASSRSQSVPTSAPPAPSDVAVPRGQQKILNALAELEEIGVERPSRTQLGMVAGYNLTGGTGGQHIADLVNLELVDIPSTGLVQLTDAGRAVADPSSTPRSLGELHARVLAKLSSGQRKIAEALLELHPNDISRAELGERVNYNLTGGTGGQHIADLVTLGVARIPSTGKVVASDLLFPAGLR